MTIEQGDIVLLNFDPTLGHEQAGSRPALVVSKTIYNQNTGFIVVCPITSKLKSFPMWVSLDEQTTTKGFVICEHIKTIDTIARNPIFIEHINENVLDKVLAIVNSVIEKDK